MIIKKNCVLKWKKLFEKCGYLFASHTLHDAIVPGSANGSFYVRFSTQILGAFTLYFMNTNGQVEKKLISRNENQFVFDAGEGSHCFNSLKEVIDFLLAKEYVTRPLANPFTRN